MAFLKYVGCLVLLSAIVASKCPPSFQEFNSACYLLGPSGVVSADGAEDQCRLLGGYLLNVDSDLEYNHIVDQIKAQPYEFAGYWIGGFFNGWEWQWKRTLANGTSTSRNVFPARDVYNWGPWQPTEGVLGGEHNLAIMVRGVRAPYAMYSENKLLHPQPFGLSYVCEANWVDEAFLN